MTRNFKPDSGESMVLQTGTGSEALKVETDGNISLTQDIYLSASKGIFFDGGTTATNYLGGAAAYEEGTWIPAGTGTATWGNGYGQYVKIGKIVMCAGVITCTAGPGTNASLTGFPFPAVAATGSPTYWTVAVGAGNEVVNTGYQVMVRISYGTSSGVIRQHNNANTWAANDRINFTITYEVA
tara:strand:+ start:987 stop:1535 length:549 start_codon:yes stop_codon:yes gene_type:complete